MKKITTFLSVAVLAMGSFSFAQSAANKQQVPFVTNGARKMDVSKPYQPVKHASSQGANDRWYNYGAVMDIVSGGAGSLAGNFLFPDSNITAEFSGNTFGSPWVHNIADVLDPTSQFFSDPAYNNAGEMIVSKTSSYALDSLEFQFVYTRNISSVDTLLIEVAVNNTTSGATPQLPTYYFTGLSSLADTVFFKDVAYNHTTYSMGVAGKAQYKVVLDSAFAADTTAGGWHLATVATTGLSNISAGRLVVSAIKFIPGYSYSLSDTLQSKNRVNFVSLEENGDGGGNGTFPIYVKRDFNASYIMTTDVRYDTPANNTGWYGSMLPSFAYMGSNSSGQTGAEYAFEHHLISYKLRCLSGCDIVSTNEIEKSESAILGLAYPNPAVAGGEVVIPVNSIDGGSFALEVYNTVGQKVTTAASSNVNKGLNYVTVSTKNLENGIYFYSLVKDGKTLSTKRFNVVK
ncbi:MAG: T9SS type A sorting domain-containing protein [Bacteroidetes bacterium]|nr:T9SS type A sorting domain-containing protein [Bacteroidota bacterium]